MRVLITGAGGQLGCALVALAPGDTDVLGTSHQQLDIADAAAVNSVLQEFRPVAIINAAGFTRVDDAEEELDVARLANAFGPAVLAEACRNMGIEVRSKIMTCPRLGDRLLDYPELGEGFHRHETLR